MSSTSVSRREKSKIEKRRRILAAAQRIFTTKGFEAATLQAIANRARVAKGTLFLYARDKHELLLMMFNDALEQIADRSISADDSGQPLREQLVRFYRVRFEFWAADVALARIVTSAVYASRPPSEAGAELTRVHARQARMVAALTGKIEAAAVAQGHLRCDARLLAEAVHLMYVGELRRWLSEERPQVEDAMAKLEGYYDILLRGAFVGNSPSS